MAKWARSSSAMRPLKACSTRRRRADARSDGAVRRRHWYGMGWVIRPFWEALHYPPETGRRRSRHRTSWSTGAWKTAHTYVGLVPERDLGIVVLANINDRTMSTRYYYTELGILDILAGRDPLRPTLFEPPWIRYGKQLVMLLFALQLATIALTIRSVRRARAGPRPRRGPILLRPWRWPWTRPCSTCCSSPRRPGSARPRSRSATPRPTSARLWSR